MTTAIRTADQVLDLLTDVAETGSPDPAPIIRNLAWHGHTPESLTAAWWAFREAIRSRAAIDPAGYPGPADCQHAIDVDSTRVDDAYRFLMSGGAR